MSRRPTPNVTPFIPPLQTPEAPQPPVIPSPGGALAGWAQLPQNPNNYPAFGGYPPTPYTNTPYIPAMSAQNTPVIPTSYTPAGPPPASIPQMSNGLSADYTGYPQMGNTPYAPPTHLAPTTPWMGPGVAAAHGPPPGTPWGMGGGMPLGHYPPFQGPPMAGPPPMAAFPGMGGGPPPGVPLGPPPPLARPQGGGHGGWPGAAFPHTPAHHGGFLAPPDPWGPPPAWAQQQQPQPAPLSRAFAEQIGDRMNRFAVGNHYGPVLDYFLLKAVKAQLQVNPLLQPQMDDASIKYLKWNMLFPSAYCQLSTDPSTVSWTAGRNEPATFPRVTSLRIICKSFPWPISVRARDRKVGVTCGEVIDSVSENLSRLAGEADYKGLSRAMQKTVGENYRRNRSRAHGVPGGRLGEGMLRLDWLGLDSMFGGIERNDRVVKEICGEVLPCTFVLACVRRYPMTEQEIRAQEERERAMRAHSRSVGSGTATSTTTSTSDDDDD